MKGPGTLPALAERVTSKVEIVDYDPGWPVRFETQAGLIRSALGGAALAIDHVGSTSVPDLAAKPVIDIVLTVLHSSREETYAPALEAAGFTLLVREPDWYEHRMFKRADPATNLHVFSQGCAEIERMKLLRDWLRAHDDDRDRYQRTKRELSAAHWEFVQDYADAKTGVIRDIIEKAGSGQPQ